MLSIVTFVALGIIGWFPPSALYPNAKASICATNLAPVGESLYLYNEKSRRYATCKIVGKIAAAHGSPAVSVSVSESVRSAIGFNRTASVRVFRIVGTLAQCPDYKPSPSMCEAPPAACIAAIPKPALSVCL